MVMRACSSCLYLTEDDACPICNGELTKDWQGFVIILDFTQSEIAKKMEFTHNGKYALKVRR